MGNTDWKFDFSQQPNLKYHRKVLEFEDHLMQLLFESSQWHQSNGVICHTFHVSFTNVYQLINSFFKPNLSKTPQFDLLSPEAHFVLSPLSFQAQKHNDSLL